MARQFRTFKKVINWVLSLLILSPQYHAKAEETAYVFLNSGAVVRSPGVGLKTVGTLRMGSYVKIPMQYLVRDSNGSVDFELTLNNWIQKSEVEPTLEWKVQKLKLGGEVKHFFPVEVARAEQGSVVPSDIKTPLIALEDLRRSGRALVTIKDSDLFEAEFGEDLTPQSADCLPGNPVRNLQVDLADVLDSVDRDVFKKLAAPKLLDDLEKPLQSCGIKPLQLFAEIKKQVRLESNQLADGSHIPEEIILSILQLESMNSKGCAALRNERNGSKSVGLFQINTGSTKKSISQLRNPNVNLSEAIRILKAKYDGFVQNPDFGPVQKDPLAHNRDLSKSYYWKLALAAYNGGEAHLETIKNDLLRFNARNQANLDVHKWEDLRLFYFRSVLRGKGKEGRYFGSKGYARSETNARINLVYAEAIMGRAAEFQGAPLEIPSNLAARWRLALLPVSNLLNSN